jgi:kynurenine formamidase
MLEQWRGWPKSTVPDDGLDGQGWIDLSHVINEEMWRLPILPKPCIRQVFKFPTDPMNVTEISMVCHLGTHVDAPRHFIPDGPSIDEIPLERLYGTGVVWRVDVSPYDTITQEMLHTLTPRANSGDIVILNTGWWKHFGSELYDQHPSLSEGAARWLVAKQVKLLAIDFATPDLAIEKRSSTFTFPVHRTLLGSGILIAENLTNLDQLAGQRVTIMLLAPKIVGSDGAPARVIARLET